MEERWWGWGKQCPPVVTSEMTGIGFEPFSGVFIVFGTLAGLGLLLAATRFLCVRTKNDVRGEKSNVYTDTATTREGVPRALLDRLDAMESNLDAKMAETRALVGR